MPSLSVARDSGPGRKWPWASVSARLCVGGYVCVHVKLCGMTQAPRPVEQLPYGDSIVDAVCRRTQDDAAILRVVLQHHLCLLPGDGKKAAGGGEEAHTETHQTVKGVLRAGGELAHCGQSALTGAFRWWRPHKTHRESFVGRTAGACTLRRGTRWSSVSPAPGRLVSSLSDREAAAGSEESRAGTTQVPSWNI